MRAAVCEEYGAPEVVRVADIPSPALGPGQVRVRVEAAAVNFPDVLLVANQYQMSVPPPFAPGSEFAGRVVEVADEHATREVVLRPPLSQEARPVARNPPRRTGGGPGTDAGGTADTGGGGAGGDHRVAVGDRVFGSTMVGAFAEEVVVAPAALSPIPDGVEARHAAAFGVAHRTACHVLRSVGRVQEGDELVVLGAGGGVGLAAVQLGVVLGARVTAVASSAEKLAVAGANGATRLVNHQNGDLRGALKEAVPGGAAVVVDPVGGDLSEPALRCLGWGGRFVTVGFAAGIPRIPLNLVLLKGVVVLGFQFRDFAAHMASEMRRNEAELLALLASGRVVPHIGASFPLDDTAAALRYVADGRAIGKVVLDLT